MPSQIFKISPVGSINRRGSVDTGSMEEVLARENLLVVGTKEDRYLQKFSGSDRFVSTAVGTRFTFLYRYYSLIPTQRVATFGYNTNGTLYSIAPNGTTTAELTTLAVNVYPVAETMRVSSGDIMFFSDGSTGYYSYDGNAGFDLINETSVTLRPVGLLSHLDRMWAFEENSENLRGSANLNPRDFTGTDSITISIGATGGSKIQAIALLGESLYIFKNDSIWVLEGKTRAEFRVIKVHPSLGCFSRFSVQHVGTGIIFLGSDYEFHFFGGTEGSTQLLTYNLALGGDKTRNLNPLINKDRVNQCYATYHNYLYRCSFVEDGETQNNMEYIYNSANGTDTLTRGNNVSCYCVYNKSPDKEELITGRYDVGRVMHQYRGLNWDNDASGATMPIKLKTKFLKPFGVTNARFVTAWLDSNVRGAPALPVRYYLDARNARSASKLDNFEVYGEEIATTTGGVGTASQEAVTSAVNLQYSGGMGQSIAFELDFDLPSVDIALKSFNVEAIIKTAKLSEFVGV